MLSKFIPETEAEEIQAMDYISEELEFRFFSLTDKQNLHSIVTLSYLNRDT
jgi:hypothetical protein